MENVQQKFKAYLAEGNFNSLNLIMLKKYTFTMTDDELKQFCDDAKKLVNDGTIKI